MYKIKAKDHRGEAVTFACGTPDQAFDKVLQLTAQGYQDLRVIDPSGKERTGTAFMMLLNAES